MKLKRILSMAIIFCIITAFPHFVSAEYATRGDVADFLLNAASYYNPSVVRSDIIKGYEDGLLHEDWSVTRAEALVMLKRAFKSLPEPLGHNKRTSLTADDFYDVPIWAKGELENVFDAGIVAGTDKNVFSPNDNVTMQQMELFVKRVYALFGENPADDFYAAANKEILENAQIPYGEYIQGTLYDMQTVASTSLDEIIKEMLSKSHRKGSPEQKMTDLYKCVMDTNAIGKNSLSPIKPYLEKIDNVKNIRELSQVSLELQKELCVSPFIGFGLTVDFNDSSKYMLYFSSFTPLMNKEVYSGDDAIQGEYISFLEKLFKVSGEERKAAEKNARSYFEFEKSLAENMLDSQQMNDVNKINNIYSFNKLQAMFPDYDLEEVLSSFYLKKENDVMVFDVNLVKDFSDIYNESNIDILKISAKISVLSVWGTILDADIENALDRLENILFGTDGSYTREQKATIVLQNVMPEYLGELYVKHCFDEKSKKDVIKLVTDIKDIFKKRIKELSWMSDATKEKAIKKLDLMKIQIGYPDSFSSYIDNVQILSPKEGGTYFSNMLLINKEAVKRDAALQYAKVDYSQWPISTYTVNAGYNLTGNSITFPAAILQSPIYDKNASYEENLGGIGYIIAHEMTHAFDSNGALFDENGNMTSWWLESDYNEFERLCTQVEAFYDGYESVPAIRVDGGLTLSENVADLGAAMCIMQLAKEKNALDYNAIFTAMANTFATTYTREYAKFASMHDVHADAKARINCVVVNLDEFYTTYNVGENDGMYVAPKDRIKIW